jgi:proteasome accessory factor B
MAIHVLETAADLSLPKSKRPPMRHAPLVRLHDLVTLLQERDGLTMRAICSRMKVSRATAFRLVAALRDAGYTLETSHKNRAKVLRIAKKQHLSAVGISTQTMAVLFLCRAVFGFLRGTGFKEDLDEFFERLERVLSYEDLVLSRSLDRKLFDYDEMPHVYEGRAEQIDVLLNGVLKSERVTLSHAAFADSASQPVVFEVYTLLVYKKGLYLMGRRKDDGTMHRLALDDVIDVERRRGDKFAYPKGYHPRKFLGEPFGIRRGKREKVALRFAPAVVKYVTRRRIHATQKLIEEEDGALTVEMTPEGFDQLDSFVFEYRDNVEVVEPAWFREEIARQIVRMGAIYGLRLTPAGEPDGARRGSAGPKAGPDRGAADPTSDAEDPTDAR